ncbi:alpha/beta hydrolase [Nocardia sp. NPDC049220]|uniref:alpha/beta fold hydrolase n=1 Tax=Nocardia sp. NPDC049220 TaxID=3155273 RepID=UPI00340116EF
MTDLQLHTRKAVGSEASAHLVLVHGSLDDGSSFRRVSDALPAYQLSWYDRRGWGKAAELGIGSVTDHVDDLTALLPPEPVILVGHSFGGTIALSVAQARPERVHAVIAYEPPLPWLPWWPDVAPWEQVVFGAGLSAEDAAEAMMRAVLGDAMWERLPARIRERRRAEGEALIAEMKSVRDIGPTFDPTTLVPLIYTCAGSESLPHHKLVSERLAELAPRGRFHEVVGATHSAHVTHPKSFAELIDSVAGAVRST